ncbi:hypothetical protein EV361DRAFT_1033437 [Lentinula raphanica]|nr:hypothetical protein EV361DRAFT_1033437 [Lentinula raphanica]
MTRFTPTQLLALLLLGAATVSSGVLAAPTTSSMNSGPLLTGVAQPEGLQSHSSPGQGSLLDVKRRGIEYANLVPRAPDLNQEQKQELFNALVNIMGLSGLGGRNGIVIKFMELLSLDDMVHDLQTSLNKDKETLDIFALGFYDQIAEFHRPRDVYDRFKGRLESIRVNAEILVSLPFTVSPEMTRLAVENHRKCLSYYPDEEVKRTAAQRVSDAVAGQQQRQSHSTASTVGQRP